MPDNAACPTPAPAAVSGAGTQGIRSYTDLVAAALTAPLLTLADAAVIRALLPAPAEDPAVMEPAA